MADSEIGSAETRGIDPVAAISHGLEFAVSDVRNRDGGARVVRIAEGDIGRAQHHGAALRHGDHRSGNRRRVIDAVDGEGKGFGHRIGTGRRLELDGDDDLVACFEEGKALRIVADRTGRPIQFDQTAKIEAGCIGRSRHRNHPGAASDIRMRRVVERRSGVDRRIVGIGDDNLIPDLKARFVDDGIYDDGRRVVVRCDGDIDDPLDELSRMTGIRNGDRDFNDGRLVGLQVDRLLVGLVRFGGIRRGRSGNRLRSRIVVWKIQFHRLIDDRLHLGRDLGYLADRYLAVGVERGNLAGPTDGRDRVGKCQVGPGVQHIRTDGAIRLLQNLEFDRDRQGERRVGGIDKRNLKADVDEASGAANAHGRDRRIDFHVAMFGGLPGDEGDGALHQRQERRIRRSVGIVDHLVQHHPRIRAEAEYRAVDEGDAERRTGAALHDVALVDVVAHVQHDRNAVADHGGVAGKLGDVADDLCGIRHAARLRKLNMPGERADDIAGETGPIGRCQSGALLADEIVFDDVFAAVLRQDQVGPGALVVAREQ